MGGIGFKRCAFIPLSIDYQTGPMPTYVGVDMAVGRCSLVQVKDLVKHARICPVVISNTFKNTRLLLCDRDVTVQARQRHLPWQLS